MLKDSDKLQQRWVKVFPHIVDTLLLGSAITMAVQYQLSPLVHTWLLAKIIGLLAYIIIGTVALKRGKTKTVRATAWLVALCLFGYIVSVAKTKSALGLLILF